MAREAIATLREMGDQMAAIVDRPTAEVGFPKLIENAGKLMGLATRLQAMERNQQLTAHDLQINHELEAEANLQLGRLNAQKARLQALSNQLQMQDHFARIAQAGMGPPPAPQQQQPLPPQQFVQPQQQPPQTNPQPNGGPRQHRSRQHGIPRN